MSLFTDPNNIINSLRASKSQVKSESSIRSRESFIYDVNHKTKDKSSKQIIDTVSNLLDLNYSSIENVDQINFSCMSSKQTISKVDKNICKNTEYEIINRSKLQKLNR